MLNVRLLQHRVMKRMSSDFARGFKTWCENVSAQKRRELGLNAIDPIDPWELAEHLGILVWKPQDIPGLDQTTRRILLKDDPDSWSAVTLQVDSHHLVILNSAHSGGRPASDLMHELSHILVGHEPARVDVAEDGSLLLNTYDKKQEAEANWLSGALLLPRDALLWMRRKKINQVDAASHFGVSEAMVRYRLSVTAVDRQIERRRQMYSGD